MRKICSIPSHYRQGLRKNSLFSLLFWYTDQVLGSLDEVAGEKAVSTANTSLEVVARGAESRTDSYGTQGTTGQGRRTVGRRGHPLLSRVRQAPPIQQFPALGDRESATLPLLAPCHRSPLDLAVNTIDSCVKHTNERLVRIRCGPGQLGRAGLPSLNGDRSHRCAHGRRNLPSRISRSNSSRRRSACRSSSRRISSNSRT